MGNHGNFSQHFLYQTLIILGLRVERTMRHPFINPSDLVHQPQHIGSNETIQKTFPNVIHRKTGHM